ncbi:MAG: outer membrane beta-barrel protein [Bacteroidetes bacterium]|nr:outer membrane beta-barrel protein [Bacteroidota bacterium]
MSFKMNYLKLMVAGLITAGYSSTLLAQDSSSVTKKVIKNKRVTIEIYDRTNGEGGDTIVRKTTITRSNDKDGNEVENIEETIIPNDAPELKSSADQMNAQRRNLEMQREELEAQEEKIEDQIEMLEDQIEEYEDVQQKQIRVIEQDSEDEEIVKHNNIKTVEQKWLIVDWGFNVWLTDNTFDLTDEYKDMNLDRSKSVNCHLGVIQQGVNLYKGKLRFVYGLGFEFNNYRFKKNVDLQKDSDPLAFTLNTERKYDKNKLTSIYGTMPLMLNFKSNATDDDEAFKLAAGIQLGYLLSSHTKQKWQDDGRKQKSKEKGDYNFMDYRIGYVVQFGYGGLNIYAKYYPTEVFKEGKGPKANTACVGLVMHPF